MAERAAVRAYGGPQRRGIGLGQGYAVDGDLAGRDIVETQQELEDPKLRPDFQWSPQQVRLDRRKLGDRFEDAIRALVGGDWRNTDRSGSIDLTRAVRSPGSALKPFIYAMAFAEGPWTSRKAAAWPDGSMLRMKLMSPWR